MRKGTVFFRSSSSSSSLLFPSPNQGAESGKERESSVQNSLLTVRVLRLRRPRVPLLEPAALDLDIELLVLGVDARAGRVEETLHPGDAGHLQHVEADHGVVVHDDGVVGLDEAVAWWGGWEVWEAGERMRGR